jgi:hypothetical protein
MRLSGPWSLKLITPNPQGLAIHPTDLRRVSRDATRRAQAIANSWRACAAFFRPLRKPANLAG